MQGLNRRTLTGAWIETIVSCIVLFVFSVAPLRVRGLKRIAALLSVFLSSRTLTGAWIEINKWRSKLEHPEGRTLTGAWIETSMTFANSLAS